MECLSANKLPIGDRWTYEIKLDGFRLEAVRTESRVILYSKQGKLLTSQFMQVALELEKLPCDTVIDGELVALDGGGVPRFNLLQNYSAGQRTLCTSPLTPSYSKEETLPSCPYQTVPATYCALS